MVKCFICQIEILENIVANREFKETLKNEIFRILFMYWIIYKCSKPFQHFAINRCMGAKLF